MMSDLLEQIFETLDRAGIRSGETVTDKVLDDANEQ
jgi:hypothetical protein